jgi:hypothetical protein
MDRSHDTASPARVTVRSLGWSIAILTIASCSTLRVGSDFDKNATFTNYHTYSIMQRQHPRVHNPLVLSRTRDAIVENLQHKGYQLATNPETADFSVDFTIGSRERTDINSYPQPYAGVGWAGGSGWWGGAYWGSNIDVRQVREGTLSIDVFDARAHRPVWHGWAKKDLTEKDIEQSEQPIRAAVAAILARFPPMAQ